jgi:hypothetical protein
VHAAAACVTVNVCPAMLSVPVRTDVAVFAVAAKLTVPFPLPGVPPVIDSHDAALVAVQAQPALALTPTAPVAAAAPTAADVADNPAGPHGGPVKVFDSALVDEPPGPTAVTRASYTVPESSGVDRRLSNFTATRPLVLIAGLPRLTECASTAEPAMKMSRRYDVSNATPSLPIAT